MKANNLTTEIVKRITNNLGIFFGNNFGKTGLLIRFYK